MIQPAHAATPPPTGETRVACHICAAPEISLLLESASFRRVTSDCKPWPAGGLLGVCAACNCVQTAIGPAWSSDAERIYGAYSIYFQADGQEQAVFGPDSGDSRPRSAHVLERLREQVTLADRGRMLDVGCGNGGLLRSYARLEPGWVMVGTEYNDRYRPVVESIPGVEAQYACAPWDVPGAFDLVTMMHVLEHIPHPRVFLEALLPKVVPGGLLLVEVPDAAENPFDLVVADHCSHFTIDSLRWLMRNAGFEIVTAASDWVAKELTVVGRKPFASDRLYAKTPAERPGGNVAAVVAGLDWLAELRQEATVAASTAAKFGLFGTSIAATWLFNELEDAVDFFVDEDPGRAGREFNGRPIYHPDDVPAESQVYLALPPKLAATIAARLRRSGVAFSCLVPPR